MLKEELNGNIMIKQKVENWQEAIRVASKPLIEKNRINDEYVEAMIENIRKFGEYIIIAPNIAMPHSRPENGVNESCVALLKLNESVKFDSGEEVKLFFILGAKDNNSHINILTELMKIIDDDEKIKKIMNATTIKEIKDII